MKRLLPYPLLALNLVLMWLLLNQSIAPAHILLGTGMACVATRTMAALNVDGPTIRWSFAIPRLAMVVMQDIIRSNFAVARIIIFRSSRPTSGFIRIPLETNNRYCHAALACIITATPGTLWIDHDSRRNILLLHVLDLVDETHWIKIIKQRYERLLMEIFL